MEESKIAYSIEQTIRRFGKVENYKAECSRDSNRKLQLYYSLVHFNVFIRHWDRAIRKSK